MVAKMSPDLTAMLAVTYLGGSSDDYPKDMAITDDGDVFVVGETYSSDFPVTAGAFAENLTGDSDAFIVRLSPDLAELLAATYYGGEDSDSTDTGNAIAVNNQGRIYIAGTTGSKELPMTEIGYKITKTLGNYGIVRESEAYVAAFLPDLTDLLAATFLAPGGSRLEGDTLCYAMEIGNDDRVYLNGVSTVKSNPFPTTEGAFDENTYQGATYTYPVYFISGFDASLTELEVSSAFNLGIYSSDTRSHSWGGFTMAPDSNAIYMAYTDVSIYQSIISDRAFVVKLPLDLNADGVVYQEAGRSFRIQDIRYNEEAGQPYITAVSEGYYSNDSANFDAYILKDNTLIFNEKNIDLEDTLSPYYRKAHYFVAGIHPDLQVVENNSLWFFSPSWLPPYDQINTSSAIILTDVGVSVIDRPPHRVMPLAFNSNGDVYMGVTPKSEVLPVDIDSYQDFIAGLYEGGILCLSSDLAKALSSDLGIQVEEIEEREEGGQKRVRIPVQVINQGPDGPANAEVELVISPSGALNNFEADLADGDSFQVDGNTLRCNLNNVPLAQTRAFEINADVAEDFSGTLNVSASVQTLGADDPDSENNTSKEEKPINVVQYCDLWVKNTNVSSGNNGWQHNIEIGNDGPWGAENVWLRNYLSPYVSFAEAEPEGYSYDPEQHTVSWELGSLAQGISYADAYKLYSAYKTGYDSNTVIENRVLIESGTQDSNPENNETKTSIGGNYNAFVDVYCFGQPQVDYLHEFTMVFTMNNTGEQPFKPEISLALPPGVELIKAASYTLTDGPGGTADNAGSGENIIWNINNNYVGKGETLSIMAEFKVIGWNSEINYNIQFNAGFKGYSASGNVEISKSSNAAVEIIRPDIQYGGEATVEPNPADFDNTVREFAFSLITSNGDAKTRGRVKVELDYNGADEKIIIKDIKRSIDEAPAVELGENQWEWEMSPGLYLGGDGVEITFTAGPYAPGEEVKDTGITLTYSYVEGEYDYSEHELDSTNHTITIPVSIKEVMVPAINLKTTADFTLLTTSIMQVYTTTFNLSNTETLAEEWPDSYVWIADHYSFLPDIASGSW
ncbi:MAG: SBBP repeat-containing protein, partial [Eubacteriales bacterium]|nr:SBBP repeat-containing protein [Eubacteriales bacterium]